MERRRPFYITEILKQHRIYDYLKSKGIEPSSTNSKGFHYCCPDPKHDDSHPSFSVMTAHDDKFDYFKCFSCGINGDIINLYCIVENVSLRQAIVHFAKGLDLDEDTIVESLINDVASGYVNYGTSNIVKMAICINRTCYGFLESVAWDQTELDIVEKAMERVDQLIHATDINQLESAYALIASEEVLRYRTGKYLARKEQAISDAIK